MLALEQSNAHGLCDRREPPLIYAVLHPGEQILNSPCLSNKETFRTYLRAFIVEDPSWIVTQYAARLLRLLPSLSCASAFQ